MPRDGSGVYTLPTGNPVVDGTAIEADWANDTMADLANEITGSLPRNGVAPMAANLAMGNNKITGLATGTATTDAVTKAQMDAADTAAIAAHAAAADPHPGYQLEDAELTAIAGLTSAANKVPMFSGSGTATLLDFVDEDNMASNSATAVPSQQSVKAYVDASLALASGTYTPTLTVSANLDSVSVSGTWRYLRIGQQVHVAGAITVDATAANALTSFFATLPVATTFSDSSGVSGVAAGFRVDTIGVGRVYAETSGSYRAKFEWQHGTTLGAGIPLSFTFTYTVA